MRRVVYGVGLRSACSPVCLNGDYRRSGWEGKQVHMEWLCGGLTNTLTLLPINTATYTRNHIKLTSSDNEQQFSVYSIQLSLTVSVF